MARPKKTLAAFVAALALLLGASAGANAHDKTGTVIVVVAGQGGEGLADLLEDALATPGTTTEAQAFGTALHSKGTPTFRAAATRAARGAQLVARAHAAAQQAGVDAAILVDLHREKKATRIHVWKIDTRLEGAVVDQEITITPPSTDIDEARAVIALVRPQAAKPEAPVAAAPTPAPTASPMPTPTNDGPPDRDTSPSTAPPADDRMLSVEAAFGVGMRHFSYTQRITTTLRAYDLAAAPMASVSAVVYPLAFTHVPVIRDFGISGDYARVFTFSSEDSMGTQVGSTWQSFDIGATQRIVVTRALVANVALGYGENAFQFDENLPGGTGQLPSVNYRFVRAGADLRYELVSAFSVLGGGSYLDVLGTGYTGSLFPRESVGGVEGHLGASYSFARNWEVSLRAAYLRFFYSADSVPGDTSVAGGALDEQTRIVGGFSYLM
jgi:hypothetical protein